MKNDYQKFIVYRMAEIQREIDSLPPGFKGERNADALGVDLCFYQAGADVFFEYLDECERGLWPTQSHLEAEYKLFTDSIERHVPIGSSAP